METTTPKKSTKKRTFKKRLSHKEEGFVQDIVQGVTGVQSALNNYDTDDYRTAGVIATENLKKPRIIDEINKRVTAEMVEKAHASLIEAVRLDYFNFPKSMSDEEITAHVESQGLVCLNIRPSDKGKLAFFSLPDGASRGKGIELYHKINGTFAPEKHVNLNVTVDASDRVKELAKKLNS